MACVRGTDSVLNALYLFLLPAVLFAPHLKYTDLFVYS